MRGGRIVRLLAVVALLALLLLITGRGFAQAQGQSAETQTRKQAQAAPEDKKTGGEVAKERAEEAGEKEENENLKHSSMVRNLAKVTGLSVHSAYYLALGVNFAIIVFLVYWLARKSVPAALARRTQSIQQALEEARAAGQEASRRLAEIETRLGQLDVEVRQMQAAAEKEGEAEGERIRKATEEDIRKVVQDAEQEIAAAAKEVRRELAAHTADLAIALARKQIHVDSETDQALVRNFAVKLSSENGGKDRN